MSDENPTVNVTDPVTGEGVDVPDHPARRRPTATEYASLTATERRGRYGETEPPGAELPVMTDRDMTTDPTEGTHGTITEIVELEEPCEACGYDRGDETRQTFAGVYTLTCRACGIVIEQG